MRRFHRYLAATLVAAALAASAMPFAAASPACPAADAASELGTAREPPQTPKFDKVAARLSQKLASGHYRTIGFGDSNMFGWPESQLAEAAGGPALNAGLGAGTRLILWELQKFDWSAQSPATIVLLVGANNLGRPPCEVYWGIRAVVDAVHKQFAQARIAVVAILPRGENLMQQDAPIALINAELKSTSGQGYVFVDAHDAFVCGHHTPCALYRPGNNFHLNADGFAILDKLVQTALKQAP